jgi:nicotinate dehydrogenase subunit A
LSQCGACTVHVDGQPVRSCVLPVGEVAGAQVTTLEGLGTLDEPHALQQAFIAEQSAQCGYCIPGMVMSAAALLAQNSQPSDGEIREALSGNLCRCGTHVRILRAVQRAAESMA